MPLDFDLTALNTLLGSGIALVSSILAAMYKQQAKHAESQRAIQGEHLDLIKELTVNTEPNGNHRHTHEGLATVANKIDSNKEVFREIRDEIVKLNENLNERPCIHE